MPVTATKTAKPRPAAPKPHWHQSRGNHQTNLLQMLVQAARDLTREMIDEHPRQCPCPFCAHDRGTEYGMFHHDLRGIEWTLDSAHAHLDGACGRCGFVPTGHLGDDLRALAAMADALDAGGTVPNDGFPTDGSQVPVPPPIAPAWRGRP